MTIEVHKIIPPIRYASRKLVRELGFMRRTIAGTGLPAVAAHCLIEIGDYQVENVSTLASVLRVPEQEMRSTVAGLIGLGYVVESTTREEGDGKLELTGEGRSVVDGIDRFARERIGAALQDSTAQEMETIARVLAMYATRLEDSGYLSDEKDISRGGAISNEALESSMEAKQSSSTTNVRFEIRKGYQPGILGRTLSMHVNFYVKKWGFDSTFESELSMGFGDLVSRLDNNINQMWTAFRITPLESSSDPSHETEEIVGTIFIDGEDLGSPGQVAHLRGFIVDDSARGSGIGRDLLREAVGFVDEMGFERTRLWTFGVLTTARRMYEGVGFRPVVEEMGLKWGREMVQFEYVRERGGVLMVGGTGMGE